MTTSLDGTNTQILVTILFASQDDSGTQLKRLISDQNILPAATIISLDVNLTPVQRKLLWVMSRSTSVPDIKKYT